MEEVVKNARAAAWPRPQRRFNLAILPRLRQRQLSRLNLVALAFGLCLGASVHGASVGASGYSTTFASAPTVADWSTFAISGGAGDVTTEAALDASIQGVAATSVNSPVNSDSGNPITQTSLAGWSSSGQNLQTRPTGVQATLLMCTLVNAIGGDAQSVTISFDSSQQAVQAEEISAHRVYYSLTGAPGSWFVIPELSSVNPGRASATVQVAWPANGTMYVLFADDNGSLSPDTSVGVDNFTITALAATQVPVTITNDPQSQIVGELAPVSFSVGAGGNPPPTIQWYSNNVPITGATGAVFSIDSTPLSYNGAAIKVVAQNLVSNVTRFATSAVATLTVNADHVAPTLVGAAASGLNLVVASFSERLAPASVGNVANYSVGGAAGSLTISNAVLDASQTNIILTVSSMTPGTNYTLTVNNVTDQSAAANPVANNSQVTFNAAVTAYADIGGATPSTVASAGNGYNVSAAGTNIAGAADQFTFIYQLTAGDFDVKVRIPTLSAADAWARSGLMARESLSADSRFAGALATPSIAGSIFAYRATPATAATNVGTFPVNYPYTWLRLSRVGNVFTGYGSFDGQNWVQMGSATLAMPTSVYLGFAASSGSALQRATVQFRDFQPAAGGTVVPLTFTREPLDACTRKTGMVISEIMYHPKDRADGKQVEFIELYNSRSIFEDLSGWRLTGDIDYTFPTGTVVQAGSFLVLAKVAADVQSVYGISGVLQYGARTNYSTNDITGVIKTNISPSLSNGGGTVRLKNPAGAVLLDINFGTRPPWPLAADGSGHSLVLARPSYGEGDPRAWDESDVMGGSPGTFDAVGPEPGRNVMINEFFAHSEPPLSDFIELYNHGNTPVNISGYWLSDRIDTNKFRIPNGTVLPARGFVSFDEATLGFGLNSSGEQIFLVNSNQNRVLDSVHFEGQANGVSSGRFPDGAPTFRELSTRTPGSMNAGPLRRPIVINEIMYDPISGNSDDEYIELYNRGAAPVNLGGWKFTDGISFTFPSNTVIAPGGYAVVAKNATKLMPKYTSLNSSNTFGNYSGTLGNGGDHVALSMPDLAISTNSSGQWVTDTVYVVVNDLTYGVGGRWADGWANGLGSSLELIDPNSDNSLAANWADSDETEKSSWTSFEFTGQVDNQQTGQGNGDRLYLIALGVGEYLIDDIEVKWTNTVTVANGNFEAGLNGWTLQGSHDQSFIDTNGFTGKALHLLAMSRGDNGANRIYAIVNPPITGGFATMRAKARWLRGFPEVLLRLRGAGLEAFGRLPVPSNLGTPGARNSRAVPNAGPAVYDVTHAPILPQAGQSVSVTARVNDSDGLSRMTLKYRLDLPTPSINYQSSVFVDNGTGGDAVAGDGLYTATIPGQAAGQLVAFYIEAVDELGVTNIFPANATRRAFPNDAPAHECLVRWGEVQMPGSFASYHLWITDGVNKRWTAKDINAAGRDRLNNAPLDATFVYNNYRVVYNMKPQYAGSPWHNSSMDGPMTGPGGDRVDYVLQFPPDNRMLGAGDFVLNTVGNPSGNTSSDTSGMAEQTSYEIFKGLGVHYNYRRYIHFFVSGDQRSVTGNRPGNFIMEDSQQPNGDEIDEWYPDDNQGQLYKIEDWFEFADSATSFSNDDADLQRRGTVYFDPILNTNVNVVKLAPYRFMWRKRSLGAGDSANDYTNILSVIDIISPATNAAISPIPDYIIKQFSQVVDIEQWFHIFGVQHTIGNWDSYGYERGKNCYTYRPNHGKFQLMTWDIDFTVGVGGHGTTQTLFDVNDQRIAAMNNTPETLRAYWRALQEIVNGPFQNSYLDPLMDARAKAFQMNNVNYDQSVVNTIKSFVSGRRTYILGQLATVAANYTITSTNIVSSSNLVVVTGTAPVDVKFITVDGISYPITWTGTTAWSVRIPMNVSGSNFFVFQPEDRFGNAMSNLTRTVSVNYTGAIEGPQTNIVFSEIMYNPLVPGAEYVELYNRSANFTFDLSGWRISGLDYTFPEGATIGPKSFLVLTRDRISYANAYGGAIPAFDQFNGTLQKNGETLALIKPGATPQQDLVVSEVRYDNSAPWPVAADGTGSSVQLIDAAQGSARVGNWAARYVPAVFTDPVVTPAHTNDGWRQVALTAAFGGNSRFLVYLDNAGTLLVDDIALVSGTNAQVGFNFIKNGDFESPLDTNVWILGTNLVGSYITNNNVHSGNGALQIIQTAPGSASVISRDILQNISPVPTNGQVCTLSFWYFATNNTATTLNVRVVSSALSVSTNIGVFIVPSNYIAGHAVSQATNYLSPSLTNSFAAVLPAFQPLWLNELQANNVTGPRDSYGEHDPWIELYNPSSSPVSLDGLYLSSDYSNLLAWPFPAGKTIAPGEFKVIWCDGQPAQTSNSELHTSFRLSPGSGGVALSRVYNGQPQVLDYITYSDLHTDRSYGSYPDGQPFDRREFYYITPGATNSGRSAPLTVFINEWMASNTNYVRDPADNNHDDWFEIYNPGTNTVDLAGYYLTDVLTNKTKYKITTSGGHLIAPRGHLLVWADNDTNQNTTNSPDLHVNFKLGASSGEIGIFAEDGTQIDGIVYGQQMSDISEGRFPDGSAQIYFMTNATPGTANYVPGLGNVAPVLDFIESPTVYLNEVATFTAHASNPDPGQTVAYSLQGAPAGATINPTTGVFTWQAGALGDYSFTVRATDNGTPPLSDSLVVTVHVVRQPGFASIARSGTDVTLTWPTTPGRSYRIEFKNNLNDAQWTPIGQALTATTDSLSLSDSTTGSQQRFYRLVILP